MSRRRSEQTPGRGLRRAFANLRGFSALGALAIALIAGAVMPTPARADSTSDFVTRLYQNFLKRAPSAAEVASYVSMLEAQPRLETADTVIQIFLESAEFQQVRFTPPTYVDALYRAILGRPADANGQRAFEAAVTDAFNALVPLFLESGEFRAVNESRSAQAFVDALYQGALGRQSAGNEAAEWVRQVSDGRLLSAVLGVLDSPEYLKRPRTMREHIGVLYLALLGRAPTARESEAWSAYLASQLRGASAGITRSAEYRTVLGGMLSPTQTAARPGASQGGAGPFIPGGSGVPLRPIGTLEDERNTYRAWGWTWRPEQEPHVEPDDRFTVAAVDVHGDTEADDLWQNLLMYRRTGQRGYWDRAVGWADYFKYRYRQSDEFQFDRNAFGADHLSGWGLVDWYEFTGDTDALAEAQELAALLEASWMGTPELRAYHRPGAYSMGFYGLRGGARHLLLAVRVAEATGAARWITLRDLLIDLWVKSPDWDPRGFYAEGSWSTDEYLGPGAWAAGARKVSTFQIGILSMALGEAYRTTGRADIREKLIAMAYWSDRYGLDAQYQYAGSVIALDYPTRGVVWHNYFATNGFEYTDPVHTMAQVDTLVRGARLANDPQLLERAKYFWHRGSKGVYGSVTERSAGEREVGRFVNNSLMRENLLYFANNKGDLQYTHLLFGESSAGVTAPPAGARMSRRPVNTVLTGPIPTDINSIPVGAWYEIPNSHLRTVLPPAIPAGFNGPGAIIDAYNGAAYDTRRDRLVLAASGGHHAYSGNEVYAFDLLAQRWLRLTDPSPVPGTETVSVLPDGRPVSRHTYGGLQYLPAVDRIWLASGARWFDGSTDQLAWWFDQNTNEWERKNDLPAVAPGMSSAYDPVRGEVIFDANGLVAYNPTADTYRYITAPGNGWMLPWSSTVVDPVRRYYYMLIHHPERSSRQMVRYRLDQPGYAQPEVVPISGAVEVLDSGSVGLDYDPVTDQLVAWLGGADVFTMNLSTFEWTRRPTTGGVLPPAPTGSGTYGRFRYVPGLNLFIVVNSIDQNVFVYRLSP